VFVKHGKGNRTYLRSGAYDLCTRVYFARAIESTTIFFSAFRLHCSIIMAATVAESRVSIPAFASGSSDS
jgi:hypothetical protein